MSTPRHGMTDEQIREVQAKYGVGPHFAADLIVFSLRFEEEMPRPVVLLIERKHPPFAGYLACPGGFVDLHEDLEAAARRELAEETGLTDLGRAHVEQLGAWGHPDRDPRARVISAVYLALVPWDGVARPQAGDDAAATGFFTLQDGVPVDESGHPRELAFDHDRVLAQAWRRIGELARTTSAPLWLLPAEFTGHQAARVWALLSGEPVDEEALLTQMSTRRWIQAATSPDRWKARSTEVRRAPAWWRT